MNKQPLEIHQYWLRTIESEYSDDLNEWEANFVVSMRTKLNHMKTSLTDKEEAALERLYEKATR